MQLHSSDGELGARGVEDEVLRLAKLLHHQRRWQRHPCARPLRTAKPSVRDGRRGEGSVGLARVVPHRSELLTSFRKEEEATNVRRVL